MRIEPSTLKQGDAELLFWYAAGTVFAIWNVFQSNGLDVRLLALGGLLPLLIDVAFWQQRFGHTLLGPVGLLAIVMLSTPGRGRRLLRRRVIALPIGWLCGTALSGAFANQKVFWWPAFGTDFGDAKLFPSFGVVLALEAMGVIAAVWCWRRFAMGDARRRALLLRTGRVYVGDAQ